MEYFVVESVYSPRDIVVALMVGVEDEARKHGCKAIHAEMPRATSWLRGMLKDRDYRYESRLWCKRSD